MSAGLRVTEPVSAREVRDGDRLVHDNEQGWIEVTAKRYTETGVLLWFSTGEAKDHGDDDRLYRVVSS